MATSISSLSVNKLNVFALVVFGLSCLHSISPSLLVYCGAGNFVGIYLTLVPIILNPYIKCINIYNNTFVMYSYHQHLQTICASFFRNIRSLISSLLYYKACDGHVHHNVILTIMNIELSVLFQ